MKNKISIVLALLLRALFSAYNVGDQISLERQIMEFGICYPVTQVDSSFSFGQHNGELNEGNYQVLMIEISASW